MECRLESRLKFRGGDKYLEVGHYALSTIK